jgi:hypothetical protein
VTFGTCDDCEEVALELHYKPHIPIGDQDGPTICGQCRENRMVNDWEAAQ